MGGCQREAVALAQHSRVQLQLVELGPQGLLVAPHIPELLCQAIRLLLDAKQVTGRGCQQPPLWWRQHQPSPPHLLLQEHEGFLQLFTAPNIPTKRLWKALTEALRSLNSTRPSSPSWLMQV